MSDGGIKTRITGQYIIDMVFDIDFSEGYTLTQIGEEYKPTVLFTLKDYNGVVLFAGSFCVRDLP